MSSDGTEDSDKESLESAYESSDFVDFEMLFNENKENSKISKEYVSKHKKSKRNRKQKKRYFLNFILQFNHNFINILKTLL